MATSEQSLPGLRQPEEFRYLVEITLIEMVGQGAICSCVSVLLWQVHRLCSVALRGLERTIHLATTRN